MGKRTRRQAGHRAPCRLTCDRPPEWCDAHHVRSWHHRGPTCPGNGVLLCGHHHTIVHRDHWTISYADDGIPELTAPTWLDPTGTPQRNHRHPPLRW